MQASIIPSQITKYLDRTPVTDGLWWEHVAFDEVTQRFDTWVFMDGQTTIWCSTNETDVQVSCIAEAIMQKYHSTTARNQYYDLEAQIQQLALEFKPQYEQAFYALGASV